MAEIGCTLYETLASAVVRHVSPVRTCVGYEGGGEEDVPDDGRHLVLEGLAARLPALPLAAQTLQQVYAAVHLGGGHTLTPIGTQPH